MDETNKNFSKIYDRYVDKIYRYVFLRVNSREAAEDLTSETFLRGYEAYKAPGSDIKNEQAFLYKIARNLVVDHYRSNAKAQLVSIEDSNIQLADSKTNIEQVVMAASDLEQVRKALKGLSEDYQNVIIWRYLEDLPVKEVAHLMDRSEEATRVLIHRALNELKNRLV